MKKIVFAIAAMLIFVSSGCSSNQTGSASESTHEVVLEELGLTYTTPAVWADYETTNLYPLTIQSDGTLARIIYNYVKEEDISSMESAADSSSYQSYLTPICEIMVAPTDNFSNGTLESLTSLYKNAEDVSEQNGYSYYVLYPCTENTLEGSDLDNYNKMADAVPELIDSISTKDFNPDDIKPIIDTDELKKYLTFETHTLEGEEISSTVFGDYDLTMVNFWGTYAVDTSNEQAVLQQVYEYCLGLKEKKVNVINAVVDTPSEENEHIVKDLKTEAGGTFTTIVMDEILANWAVENLEGVPTTVFVNSEGKIISDQIKGAKSAQTYINDIEYYLASGQ